MIGKTWGLALGLWAAWLLPAFGQEDLGAMGGAVDSASYEETGDGLIVDEAATSDIWTAVDSAFHFPAYATYGDWNTDQIFPRRPVATDTVELRLAWEPCDHHMPICGRITSRFGPRRGRHHYGTDLKLQTGDPVMSAFAGKVRISRYHREFGNVVVVRHPNGLETLYAHLSKRQVEMGDELEAGDLLGLGGSTGRSTGSHLHFETRYLGHPIDPELLFDLEEGELRADRFAITPSSFHSSAITGLSAYRVRKGDTLYAIARRSGLSVSRLCKINGISARSTLRVGQRLRLN